MTDDAKHLPEHWITEDYCRRLEANIKEQPSYWLWSHDRWKRTRKGYLDYLRRNGKEKDIETEKFFDHEHPEGILLKDWERNSTTTKQHNNIE